MGLTGMEENLAVCFLHCAIMCMRVKASYVFESMELFIIAFNDKTAIIYLNPPCCVKMYFPLYMCFVLNVDCPVW